MKAVISKSLMNESYGYQRDVPHTSLCRSKIAHSRNATLF